MINGIINVYKEKGYTSHDVVAKLRGILKQKRIGHTGTLDPDATGVLPVCLGTGTKLCEFLTDQSKEYEASFLLGVTTDTQDMSGTVLDTRDVLVSKEEIQEVLTSYVGEYPQIPPMYSALKVDGKKLYELAREGKVIERKPRNVRIHQITVLELQPPRVKIRVSCSKGTYIRTLCHDVGEKLGCGAAMTELVRTRVGNFSIDKALTLAELETCRDEGRLSEQLVTVESVFSNLQRGTVKAEFAKFLENGNRIFPAQLEESLVLVNGQQVRIYHYTNQFCAIYEYQEEKECLIPFKMFLDGEFSCK